MWNVLIAEDDFQNKKKLLDALKGRATCTDVSSGQQALDAYKDSLSKNIHFDFILLDVTMPKMDGFAVLKAIRAQEENLTPPRKEAFVIMITAYKDSLMEKYNMGWDDFITKPVDKDVLIKHMERLVHPARHNS
ncbi:MAG: response regulator [Candidatus Omnitrophica bacterium]|nr:response regulator [Candidatus Omnitrophota bacterium]